MYWNAQSNDLPQAIFRHMHLATTATLSMGESLTICNNVAVCNKVTDKLQVHILSSDIACGKMNDNVFVTS